MAVTTATELGAQLATYRRRIRSDRRWQYLAVAAFGVGAVWMLAALLHYFDLAPSWLLPAALLLTVLLPAAAMLVEYVKRPSLNETAATIDSRLDNKERVTTAVQLLDGRQDSELAQAQMETTTDILMRADPRMIYPERRPWPVLALSGGLLFVAFGIFMLKGALGVFDPLQAQGLPPNADNASAIATTTALSNLPGAFQPTPPPGGNTPGAPGAGTGEGGAPGDQPLSPQEAAAQAQASKQAEEALKTLGENLDGQGAAQSAADNIKSGDYQQAGEDLDQLGQESDQLSEQAKEDLAQSLDHAADASDAAPDLQQAERDAADALRSGNYKDTAQALKDLGEAVEQTGDSVVPQDQQAQNYPATPQAGGQQGDQGQSGDQGQQGQQGQGDQGDQGQGQSGQQGDQGQDEQGGQSTGGDPSDTGTRVGGATTEEQNPNVAGNPFELEGNPDPGATNPGDGSTQPGLTLEGDGNGGASSGGIRQTGDTVSSPSESNSQPVERRGIIQKYFEHGN